MRSLIYSRKLKERMQLRRKEIFYFFKDNIDLLKTTADNTKHDPQLLQL